MSSKAEPKKRLSLVERQRLLLEEKGFSAPGASRRPSDAGSIGSKDSVRGKAGSKERSNAVPSNAGRSVTASAPISLGRTDSESRLLSRNDEMLIRQGRGNATAASRNVVPLNCEDEDGDDQDGTKSVGGASVTPSIHPSLAGSIARSMACSESTIGAGDNTRYWDYQHRSATKADLGHACRECRKPFSKIGEPITERRGARVSMRYHAECFSGFADPRSQARSSHHEGNLVGTQHGAAPSLESGKMRTASHFSGSGTSGKNLANQLAIGRLSFQRSDRGSGIHQGDVTSSTGGTGSAGTGIGRAGTELTAAKLEQLNSVSDGKRGASLLLERVLEDEELKYDPQHDEPG